MSTTDSDSDVGAIDMAGFKVIYDGDQHDIDANVLLDSIGSVTDLVSVINREIGDERDLKIRIEAPERGSFGIDLSLLSEAAGMVMSAREEIMYTSSIVTLLTALYKVHRFFGGGDPDEVEDAGKDVRIYNNDGDVIEVDKTVYNIYAGSEEAREKLDSTYDATRRDDRITEFRIEDSETGEERFSASQDEFDKLAGTAREDTEPETREVTDRVTLTVVRVVFERDRRWEFLHQGETISAKIADIGFWARVENREENFASGDRLDVDLKRTQEYVPRLDDWVTKRHEVAQVHDHTKQGKQGNMFGDAR